MISVLKAIAQTVLGEQSLPQHVCLFYPKEGYKVGSVELDLILDEDHSKIFITRILFRNDDCR